MRASTSLTDKRFLVPLVRPELAQPERGLAPDIG